MGTKRLTYNEAGVNLELGNSASEIFDVACKKTYQNRKGRIGDIVRAGEEFSELRHMSLELVEETNKPCMIFGANTDGIGTAVEVAQRINKHNTMGYNLVAMVADDAVRYGAEPFWMTNVLDVNSLEHNLEYIKQLADGLVNAANEAGIAVINGEIAELGELVGGYGSFRYNWNASTNWVTSNKKIIDGKSIEPGHSLVGLIEKGFRSNGFTLIRKIMEKVSGREWHENQQELAEKIIERPTIYSRLIIAMHGSWNEPQKAKITGIAHITGGGIPEKLRRLLQKKGYGAIINNPIEPCEAMKVLQGLGSVTDKEAYRTWNMGQGMIIVTPEPTEIIEHAKRYGIHAQEIGKVKEDPKIIIVSKGIEEPEKELVF